MSGRLLIEFAMSSSPFFDSQGRAPICSESSTDNLVLGAILCLQIAPIRCPPPPDKVRSTTPLPIASEIPFDFASENTSCMRTTGTGKIRSASVSSKISRNSAQSMGIPGSPAQLNYSPVVLSGCGCNDPNRPPGIRQAPELERAPASQPNSDPKPLNLWTPTHSP